MNQFYEHECLKLSHVRALQNWFGIILQLVVGRSLIISFCRALLELSLEKIFHFISQNGREIFLEYSHPHSVWATCYIN